MLGGLVGTSTVIKKRREKKKKLRASRRGRAAYFFLLILSILGVWGLEKTRNGSASFAFPHPLSSAQDMKKIILIWCTMI